MLYSKFLVPFRFLVLVSVLGIWHHHYHFGLDNQPILDIYLTCRTSLARNFYTYATLLLRTYTMHTHIYITTTIITLIPRENWEGRKESKGNATKGQEVAGGIYRLDFWKTCRLGSFARLCIREEFNKGLSLAKTTYV